MIVQTKNEEKGKLSQTILRLTGIKNASQKQTNNTIWTIAWIKSG